MTYPVVDVSGWEPVNPEPVGREAKVWLRPPGTGPATGEHDWLFKPVVVPSNGHRQGEDWAEKIVSELAGTLGVPCAEVELAVRGGVRGSISRNVAPDGWSLVLGSVLLSAHDPDYVEGEQRPAGRPGHSPVAILEALQGGGPPPGVSAPDAGSVFAGFVLLDAWVGNQDRHDQNWAVLRRTAGSEPIRLAPSFDHASSLGFNLRDSSRTARLQNGLDSFVARARAHRFEHDPVAPRAEIPDLVHVARAALDLAPAGRCWWEALEGVADDQMERIVAAVPRLSVPAGTFVREMLRLNRERLLDVR